MEGGLAAQALPLLSLHTAAALLILALSVLWLASGRDDWSAIPGPPAPSYLLGHLQQVRGAIGRRVIDAGPGREPAGGY